MTAWDRVRDPGAWHQGSVIKPSEMEEIDGNLAKAPNFTDGGAYSPSSAVDIGGSSKLKVDTPVASRDVANRLYVDDAVRRLPRLGDQSLDPGYYAAVFDTAIGALHVVAAPAVSSSAVVYSSHGRAALVSAMTPVTNVGFESKRVSIAQDPATGALLRGRGSDASTDELKLLCSTDRKTWPVDAGATVLPNNTAPPFVWWTGTEFLVLHVSSSTALLYTFDGTTLSSADGIYGGTSGGTDVFEAAFNATKVVVVRQGASSVYWCDLSDLTNWPSAVALPSGTIAYDVAYSEQLALFVLVGRDDAGPCLLTSPDGATWTAVSITDPWPITGTGGILTSICEVSDGLVGVFHTQNDYTTPTSGTSQLGLSRDGGATWAVFDSLPGLVEKVRPAPAGIVAIGHPGSTTGVYISG